MASVLLTVAGCLDSPFTAKAELGSCGLADQPCPLSCAADCIDQVMVLSSTCATPLLGSIDAGLTQCAFGDGARAVFDQPLDLRNSAALVAGGFAFSFYHRNQRCLRVEQTTDRLGVIIAADEVFAQQLLAPVSRPAVDPLLAGELSLRCPSGRHFRGQARALCAGCDAGCRGLLTLAASVVVRAGQTTLSVGLARGAAQDLLFSCSR